MQGYLPREKLVDRGIEAMTDADLLGILVSSGVKGRSFDVIAREVLGVIRRKVEARIEVELEDIAEIGGMGKVKAGRIVAALEMGRRLYGGYEGKKMVSSAEQAFVQVSYLARRKQEHLIGLFLNARYELLSRKTIGIGTLNKLTVVPRDVIIPALYLNSAAVILAHNHPSGDCEPSEEDFAMTRRIKDACDLVGLILLDHIVVGKQGWKSAGVS